MIRDVPDAALAELERHCPGRVSVAAATLVQHANTLSIVAAQAATAVVWPSNTQDVKNIVEIATRYGFPLIPFGAGTSLEGHVNAPYGGVSIDMSRMNLILEVNPDDMDCHVGAGVTRRELVAHLRDTGLFFSVDPGAEDATLGGMAATRASGTNTVRYGSMRDNVLGLTAVMADGSLITTGSRARKSAAGYDLTRLLIGSEGTLGIITSLTLRLHPVPGAIAAAVAVFPNIESACNTSIAALALGGGLARVEFLDATAISAINKSARGVSAQLRPAPSLFFEIHGSLNSVEDNAKQLCAIATEFGALSFDWTAAGDHRALWKARHDAFWSIREAWPGRTPVITDVCVPVSKLASCVCETVQDCEHHKLIAPIVGHVGDGNFHAIIMVDKADVSETARLQLVLDRLVTRALEYGGTCTGEHGIGQGKMSALAREAGAGLDVMRAIKTALDPECLFNPGKIF